MPGGAQILWWLFAVSAVVLIAGLGVTVFVAQRRLAALTQEYAGRLLQAHEEERVRVAREVHDDAVQRIVLLGRELDKFVETVPGLDPESGHHLAGIQNELHDLADVMRSIAHRLHPAVIEHAGLSTALSQLAEETNRLHRFQVTLDLPVEVPQLSHDVSLALFRIAQEGIWNAIRHSGGCTALLTLRHENGTIELTIPDYGVGFDQTAEPAAGIGLVGISERARLVGGAANIWSQVGEGTAISVRMKTEEPL